MPFPRAGSTDPSTDPDPVDVRVGSALTRGLRLAQALVVTTAIGMAVLAGIGSSSDGDAAADTPATAYYLDLGGSGSVGYQPTLAHPGGQPTDTGYANDLLVIERHRWPTLQLVQLGCPGETTEAFQTTGDPCRAAGHTQLGEATDFLRSHPTTVLMTIDLGFNNLLPCFANEVVDLTCVSSTLEIVHEQLSQIITILRAASTSGTLHIVGIGHYDPYLASYIQGGVDENFSLASVDAIVQLNRVLKTTYGAAGIPIASVADPYEVTDTKLVPLSHVGLVPQDVERTCSLTWNCTPGPLGPNPHPNDAGYQLIAQAIAAVVPS
jgi:hypothetical protein